MDDLPLELALIFVDLLLKKPSAKSAEIEEKRLGTDLAVNIADSADIADGYRIWMERTCGTGLASVFNVDESDLWRKHPGRASRAVSAIGCPLPSGSPDRGYCTAWSNDEEAIPERSCRREEHPSSSPPRAIFR